MVHAQRLGLLDSRHALGGAADALAGPLAAGPRDKTFKLVELGCLRILPPARGRRAKLFFTLVGFDKQSAAKLQGIFAKHDVQGLGFDGPLEQALDTVFPGELDRASGSPASARFDCLSVLGRAAGGRVLDLVVRGQFRPGLIHCADTETFADWGTLRSGLIAKGYACVGELEGAELFIDAPLFEASAERPTVGSFDVFDTLIARRCFEPWRIFEAVGARIGLPDFVEQRRSAEGRVIDRQYVFDDIYDELARHYGWSTERRREVQALELSCEIDAAIPITENLSRVADGDLLVSDMYLSEAAIRSLLAKAGLAANVGLLVESHGKSSGRVWPIIDQSVRISRHLGDNPHADVAVPARFGIATALTKASDLNVVEQTLMQTGLRDLALLCREARLRSWHEDPGMRALQSVQTSLNLPILILASVFLARRAAALGSSSLSFCSRDGNLWQPLFNIIQGKMGLGFDTTYFLTSRIARNKGSDAYLRYARDHVGEGALVVDLCGTGWSMAFLAERLGRSGCDLFLLDHCPPQEVLERARPTPSTCVVHRLFEKRPNANNFVLELANMGEHGMVTDMREVGSAAVPILAPLQLSATETVAVQEQRKCFLDSLAVIPNYGLRDVLDLDDASISLLSATLYEYMSTQLPCYEVFAKTFLSENAEIVRSLTN